MTENVARAESTEQKYDIVASFKCTISILRRARRVHSQVRRTLRRNLTAKKGRLAMKNFDPRKLSFEAPAVKNPHPLPEELRKENFNVSAEKEYVHFQAENGLYLDIDDGGWAFWSGGTHAIFSKYDWNGDLYLIYEYGNAWTGYYLSYKNNGYVCLFKWGDSVAWDTNPLRVKGKSWKTYEYTTDKTWVVIGDYDYTERDLFEKGGF